MQKRAKKLTKQQKDSLAQAIVEQYERDPISVEKAFPNVARILQNNTRRLTKERYGEHSTLTELEKGKRLRSLYEILEKMKAAKRLTKDEAIQALENIAALVETFSWEEPTPATKKQIADLIKVATGLALRTRGKVEKVVLGGGSPAREVFLLRGVKLELTWDKKLLSIEVDPKELAIREKLLSIIGIGTDTATDVSTRHDEYFVEAISGR